MIEMLLTLGCVIIGALGLIHLVYTFRTDHFEPRDSELSEKLRTVSPVLTSETTMWKAWVGFNASHSLGALLFAALYGYFARFELWYLLSSPFLMGLSLVVLVIYLVLARLYWFSAPFMGIAAALALFIAGYGAAYLAYLGIL